MANIRVRIISNDLSRLSGKMRTAAENIVGEVADTVASEWRAAAPRQSGSYASSIGVERSGMRATVTADATRGTGAGAPYSYPVAVEYGNARGPAQPAATPAAERNRQRFRDQMRDVL